MPAKKYRKAERFSDALLLQQRGASGTATNDETRETFSADKRAAPQIPRRPVIGAERRTARDHRR